MPSIGTGAPLIGEQTPRINVVPPYVRTFGSEVNGLMDSISRPGLPWQRNAVDVAFGVDEYGQWCAFELLVLLARQNGKGWVTDAIELGSLFLFRTPLMFHSAHLFQTSRAAFQRLEQICLNHDWLRKQVGRVSHSKSDESIGLLRRGGEIDAPTLAFIARTNGSGRGRTGHKTIFDESFALTVGQYQAQTPTLATIPNPQIIYTSTPPDEDNGPMPDDAMLPSVRERGHAGIGRIACLEWSPPAKHDPSDPEVHRRNNPSMGPLIAPWFLETQYRNFAAAGKPGKFSTDHLGAWPPSAKEQWRYLPKEDWQAAQDPQSHRVGRIAVALELSTDRQWGSISIAGRRADGMHHVEVAVSERGSAWMVGRLTGLRDKLTDPETKVCDLVAVVVPGGSPATALLPDLEAAGFDVHVMTAAESTQACGGFWDAVSGPTADGESSPRTLRHRGQRVFTMAVAAASVKRAGNTRTWDPSGTETDISPAMGAAAALWAFRRYGNEAVSDYDPLDNIF